MDNEERGPVMTEQPENEESRRVEGTSAAAVDGGTGVEDRASKDTAASPDATEPSSRKRKVDWALEAAAMGYFVFPWRLVERDGRKCKMPCIKEWEQRATRDPAQIRAWWQLFPGANIAAAVGRSDVTVADEDNKDGQPGRATRQALESANGRLPRSRIAQTPTTGLHFHMLGATGSNAGKLGRGLDVRGSGGWIAMPGSTTPQGAYEWLACDELRPAPDWFVEFAGAPRARSASRLAEPESGWDDPADIEWARSFLAETAKPAVEGSGGDNTTFVTACFLRDRGICEETALELMAELYNKRCVDKLGQPAPWTDAGLARKVTNAFLYAKGDAGDSSAAADFPDDIDEGRESVASGAPAMTEGGLSALNRDHFVVDEGGKFRVYRWGCAQGVGSGVWTRYARQDFEALHSDRQVEFRGRATDLGAAWVKWTKRRAARVAFDPSLPVGLDEETGTLNLWTGWAVEPAPGDWGLMKRLVHEIICAGNDGHFEYAMNWMANLVQRPDRPAEVAFVMRGKKGTGKGTLGRALTDLFGAHGVCIASPGLLTGRFSSHLRECVALFADEAFGFAGNKADEGKLKQLVTEPRIMYEGKGTNAEMGPNMLHLIVASNERWVVPATPDERRFFVVDVSEAARGDKARFGEIGRQMRAGGLAAMLHELLSRGISGWHPRDDIPSTAALVEQKLHTLPPVEAWWHEALKAGELPGVAWPQGGWALVKDLVEDYAKTERALGIGGSRRQLETHFGMAMRGVLPRFDKRLVSVPQERIDLVAARAYAYLIPPLGECRAHFASAVVGDADYEWGEVDPRWMD
jgi:hypothetical protein